MAIGPYNLYMSAYNGSSLLEGKFDLAEDMPCLLLVASYIRFFVQIRNIACMDCLRCPFSTNELGSRPDLVMHMDHRHIHQSPSKVDDILLLRGSVCAGLQHEYESVL